MSGEARYLFTAAMDVMLEKEALFNEVYDTEHTSHVLTVLPGQRPSTRGGGRRQSDRIR